jgi:hypothetical protein
MGIAVDEPDGRLDCGVGWRHDGILKRGQSRPAALSCAYWVTLTVPAVMVHTVCALGPRPLEQHCVVVVY